MPIVCCFQKTSIKYILNRIKLEKSLQRNCFRFKWRICASVAFCNKICFWFIGKFNIFIAWSNFRYAFVAKSSLHICFQIKLENFDLWSKKLFFAAICKKSVIHWTSRQTGSNLNLRESDAILNCCYQIHCEEMYRHYLDNIKCI